MDIQARVFFEKEAIASPAPLGLFATAIANWATGVRNVGWSSGNEHITIMIFYGGLAQFVAGLWCMPRKETLGALAFTTYGAWWISIATAVLFFGNNRQFVPDDVIPNLAAWLLVLIFISNTYFFICSIQTNPVSIFIFIWLGLSELLLFAGLFVSPEQGANTVKAGGAVQIILAIFCFYSAFAQTWNEMAGRNIIPLGNPVLDLSEKKDS